MSVGVAQPFSLRGLVRTPDGKPIGYAIIRLPYTGFQSIASIEGAFTLSLLQDTVTLEIRHLGYKTYRAKLNLDSLGSGPHTFVLYPQEIVLPGIIITQDDRDPGETLIRRAIAAKAANRRCLSAFQAEAYTLYTVRVRDISERLWKLLRSSDSLPTGILLLSEAFSTLYFVAPDKYREEIRHSRFIGQRRYSFLGNWIFAGFDPYGERAAFPELTETPFVLPLATDAPLYYTYRLLGSFYEEGILFYKIQVVPKSRFSPCVEGYVIIADESYALVGLEWQAQAPRPLRYTDSLSLRATYIPVGGCYAIAEINFWGDFHLSVSLLGEIKFRGEGYASYRRYVPLVVGQKPSKRRPQQAAGKPQAPTLGPSEAKETLRVARIDFGEMVWISPRASAASEAFWDSVRSAPLDSLQAAYIQRHDSLIAQRDSAAQTARLRRWEWEGWGLRFAWPQRDFRLKVYLGLPAYTPLEGWALPFHTEVQADKHAFSATVRYGFGWEKALVQLGWRTASLRFPLWRLQVRGGTELSEPTEVLQVPLWWNTLYYLWRREHLWQGYPRTFIEAYGQRHLSRAVVAALKVGYDQRSRQAGLGPYYYGVRIGVGLAWQPGVRLFTTPRRTLILPPERTLTWEVQGVSEVAFLPLPLLAVGLEIRPTLGISPFGRLYFRLASGWQNRLAPWADALYLSAAPFPFHLAEGEFRRTFLYTPLGVSMGQLQVTWRPEGSLVRLIPLFRRSSWQESFTLRLAQGSAGPLYAEGSFYLLRLALRLRKTDLSQWLSIGFHAPLRSVRGGWLLTVGLGEPAFSPLLPKLSLL
ncbi:MAG: DUF5686 family protein [Bacteroidia bacterium]|nr:DUF5686 family protein [Bacteroidia bacterium]MDW8088792.1 DUF5686 family protein [Bacteroidia bacterium]